MKPRLLLVLMLAGCGVLEPENGARFDPPAYYRTIYQAVEACTGRSGSYGALRFYVVPVEGMDMAGMTYGQDIYIREDFVGRHLVVKHEMIHALLGTSGHPYRPFVEPCHATWGSEPVS